MLYEQFYLIMSNFQHLIEFTLWNSSSDDNSGSTTQY